jgi:hypothetical protein
MLILFVDHRWATFQELTAVQADTDSILLDGWKPHCSHNPAQLTDYLKQVAVPEKYFRTVHLHNATGRSGQQTNKNTAQSQTGFKLGISGSNSLPRKTR